MESGTFGGERPLNERDKRRIAFLRAIVGDAGVREKPGAYATRRRRKDPWPELAGFDHAIRAANGAKRLCGVDEVGRGPLAGPVVAAAVILPVGSAFHGLDDSKRLSAKARVSLFRDILREAEAVGVGVADARAIDSMNILRASLLAMRRAWRRLGQTPDLTLVDGNREIPSLCARQLAVVDGDALSACVAAASVVAKVYRDRLMVLASSRYPDYQFELNKGYGTPEHCERLRQNGPCPLHRLTFIERFLMEGDLFHAVDGD